MHSPRYGSFRSFRLRCSWLLLVLACYAPSVVKWQHASAAEPNTAEPNTAEPSAGPDDALSVNDEVETLIDQLSSPAFATREAASKRLLEIGAPTLEMLRKAKQHTAIEVRERANRICEEIDKVIFESITKKFILAADGTESFGLPAWDVFRSISGDSRTSKLLFVTMLRSQSELARYVEAASKAKGTANSAVAFEELAERAAAEADKLRVRSFRGELPSVGDTVGLLMASSLFSDTLPTASASNEVNEIIVASLYRAPQAEYFTKAGYDRCMRALAGQWIHKTQASLANDVLSIALQRSIPEGAAVARRHLDPSNDRETRVFALQCLARFGNEGDIASVSKLLNEELVVYEFTDQSDIGSPRDGIQEDDMPPPGLKPYNPPRDVRRMVVRLNDVAMAVCMVLGSEDLTAVFPKYKPNESNGMVLVDFAFPADGQEKHKLAIARWKHEHPQFVEENH